MTKKHRSTSQPNPPDGAVTPDLLAQLADTLWLPRDMNKKQRAARIATARAQLEDIAPGDGIESMLAVQMIATHEASMACLQRATRGDPSPELCDQNLKHAERLLAIYARQMDVLGRHRLRQRQRRERADQQEMEQEDEKLIIDRIERVYINPDGTEATPEDLAEDLARRIADGTVVITPPRAKRENTQETIEAAAAREAAQAAEAEDAEATGEAADGGTATGEAVPDDWTPEKERRLRRLYHTTDGMR